MLKEKVLQEVVDSARRLTMTGMFHERELQEQACMRRLKKALDNYDKLT